MALLASSWTATVPDSPNIIGVEHLFFGVRVKQAVSVHAQHEVRTDLDRNQSAANSLMLRCLWVASHSINLDVRLEQSTNLL
jgi:hypothetical protein